jgi:hypothetical protein
MVYAEEVFTLSDGGSLLLQWSICENGKRSTTKTVIKENDEMY